MKRPANLMLNAFVKHVSRVTPNFRFVTGTFHEMRADGPTAANCRVCGRLVIRGAGRWWE